LGWRAARQAVALVAAAEIVVHEELIEVALNLLDADIPGRAARDAETLVEERAIHALNEAIGARRANPRGAGLDALERKQELLGVTVFAAAALAPILVNA